MKFSTETTAVATNEILASLRQALAAHDHIVWLVSGGSCVEPQVKIFEKLTDTELTKLSIRLVDERYGTPGHVESNFAKLSAAGLSKRAVDFSDVLAAGLPFPETVDAYSESLQTALARAGSVIATLGMGADGHTAGILPHSPAATDSTSTAIGYEAADFRRITAGFTVLKQIDQAFVLAYGEAKQPALNKLAKSTGFTSDLPITFLCDLHQTIVYNDSINKEIIF